MISYTEAVQAILQSAVPQPSETLGLLKLLGRVTATDVVARVDVPAFDNSAMDGFAVHAEATAAANPETPCVLQVVDCLAAGDAASQHTATTGQAIEIMTGARVPAGLDAIAMIEHANPTRDAAGKTLNIRLEKPLHAGENLRYRGEDFQTGEPVVRAGTRLNPHHLAALAATGIGEVDVRKPPEIALFATGKEVSDAYDTPLADSQIYNSNVPYLYSQLTQAGFPTRYVGNIGDEADLFARWLDELTTARVLISSGAVSKGRWDFIPEILKQKGARIVFHGVAIKPGKPVLFAILPDGRYFFGLPGNPISTAIGLRFFVQPLLRALVGMPAEDYPRVPLSTAFSKKGPLRLFLKARLGNTPEGQFSASLPNGQESFRLSPLLTTNAWAIVPEDVSNLAMGDTVSLASATLFPQD